MPGTAYVRGSGMSGSWTRNKLIKFGMSMVGSDLAVEESLISDDGATITITGALVVTGGVTATVAGLLDGSGTGNTLALWSDGNTLADSPLLYDGSTLLSTTKSLALGATPATAGTLRLPSTGTIQARNAAASANRALLQLTGTDVVTVGDATVATQLLGSAVGFFGATPVAKAANVANPTDLTTLLTAVPSILTLLQNYGLMA